MLEICLGRRPTGIITTADFVHLDRPAPQPDGTAVITRTQWISVDPYLVMRMQNAAFGPGGEPQPIISRTIGLVEDPGASLLARGDLVLGFGRWAEMDSRPPNEVEKIDTDGIPASAYLGAVGHSGFTAWLGLKLGSLRAGETVSISGAAGSVGIVAGQLAKAAGCRVIGIAGGAEKTRWLTGEIGFDACADHRKPDLEGQIAALAPDGIDLHFENVGASTLDPAIANMRRRGRIMLCGLIQHYQDAEPVALRNFRRVLAQSISIQPFSIYDHQSLRAEAQRDLEKAFRAGALKRAESVTDGIANAPDAFVSMLARRGHGKHLVKVG